MNLQASMPVHETAMVQSGDVQIFYPRFGQRTANPSVLIAHGLSYFSYDWIQIAAELCDDREVVAVDLRGFGDSSWSDSRAYELQDFSRDIPAVQDHLGWSDAVGRICLVTAAWQPKRVRGLVCLDFAPDVMAAGRRKVAERIGRQPEFFSSVDAAMEYHGHHEGARDPQFRARWQAYLRPSPGGFVLKRDLHFRDYFLKVLAAGSAPPLGVDLWAMVKELQVPALFVRGAESDMFAQETLTKLFACRDKVRIAEISGGHALMDDQPKGVVAQVKQFLAGLPCSLVQGTCAACAAAF